MELTPSQHDRLLIFSAAQLAATRRARGTALNAPEATALIASAVIEAARDGATHAQALHAGLAAVSNDDLLPGAAALIGSVSVEGVFDDGRRLVVVDFPAGDGPTPGEVIRLTPAAKPDAPQVNVEVHNTAPVTISVTTHFHFFEVNHLLAFDRASAYGMRLAIPAGEHVDFPAGQTVSVGLVPIGGERVVIGFAGLVDGPLDAPGARERALERAKAMGYLT